ncbi:T9SS type A sorting domain-containing protein [Winogradskyella immobilis]|uniref:T9SS type A sorting domain-containing protein n=1 Tax=Winogradskyella immobilis TaxID=2816852 RepID=A0ABS8EJU0_9FLAO|nr:T9SS type A sorting domain-containing protein [Winogradskyella immobilis]MCC1483221.1 T9SS type A sorting domain-containing protein [Winogradskyella immobilis]MCG0015315.1 T9SS type A sorting domain-containing protein [Winogradskyella immobilis]
MKNFITYTSLLLFINLFYAQEINVPEPDIDSMLINIDKKTLKSSFLYERTTPLANLVGFNNETRNESTLSFFEQALQELYKSSKKDKYKPAKQARKDYKEEADLSIVDIGVIHNTLYRLNYNSEDESLGALSFNGNIFTQINDNPPFLSEDLLIISPLLKYAVGSLITFKFKKKLFFEDHNNKIESIKANFDTNENYIIYSKNNYKQNELVIQYAESGYKKITFEATYEDGTTKITYGKFHVKTNSSIVNKTSVLNRTDPLVEDVKGFVSTIPFQGYDETSPIFGELDYRVFYHTNGGNAQRTLLKPIIIIDGFDPGDKRKIQDEDSPLPSGEHTSIEEFMIYFDNQGTKQELIPVLRNLGYDVILVNQPTYTRGTKVIDGGADYIERNALSHVSLYQHLNNTLFTNNSSEELVIVGPSMGGQISRYALAYMEKHNINHNTRLWVSIDSPHLGANIPMGIQSMINLLDVFGDSVAAEDFYFNQLKSTASNQQLIEQHLINHLPDYLNGGSPVHQQYYNNMESNGLPNSNGYPQNLRKIAIVNGSLEGVKVGVEAEEDFRVHGFVDQLWWTIKVAEMNTNYMPSIGVNKQVARLWRELKPLRTASYTNNNPRGSLDVLPGGLFNSEDQIHNSVIGQSVGISNWDNGLNFGEFALGLFGIWGDHFESRTNKQVHSFIPTVSALGFNNPNFNWGQKLDRNLVCSNEIPFDSYFGPKVNEQHTSFTENSVNWLLQELAGNTQDPYFPVNSNNLIGEEIICSGEIETYTFNNCKVPGNVATWEVSNNIQILSSTGNSITIRTNSDHRSFGTIKAIFENNIEVEKEVWLGKPTNPNGFSGPRQVLTGSVVNYLSGNIDGATSYMWDLPLPYSTVSSFNFSSFNWQQLQTSSSVNGIVAFTGTGGINGYVRLKGQNKCGVGSTYSDYITHDSSGGKGGIGITPSRSSEILDEKFINVYPNPSDDLVNISLRSRKTNVKKEFLKIDKVLIFDQLMVKVKEISYLKDSDKVQINLKGLSAGIYYIKVSTNERDFNLKIIKK